MEPPKRKTTSQNLIGTWTDKQIGIRISEIEEKLEQGKGTLSKTRRKQLYARISALRKALAGDGKIGGNLEAKRVDENGKKIKKRPSKPLASAVDGRWKECLCCRGKGHTMQECRKNPERLAVKDRFKPAKKTICFNCGKDDHTLKNCPEPRNSGQLPYASCFICGGTGHIASQCEKNTTGIYPKGGGCHVCSSPYHLMKDCPSKPQQGASQPAAEPKQWRPQQGKRRDDDNDAYWE